MPDALLASSTAPASTGAHVRPPLLLMIAGLHIRGLPAGNVRRKTALRQRAVSRQIRFT